MKRCTRVLKLENSAFYDQQWVYLDKFNNVRNFKNYNTRNFSDYDHSKQPIIQQEVAAAQTTEAELFWKAE